MMTVQTCAEALLNPGTCCACEKPATTAALVVIDYEFTEHTYCAHHVQLGAHRGDVVAAKPLIWDPVWGPQT